MSILHSAPTGQVFFGRYGEEDVFYGGESDDHFIFAGVFGGLDPYDTVHGGGGYDRLYLQGEWWLSPVLRGGLIGIEELVFLPTSDARFGTAGTGRTIASLTLDAGLASDTLLRVDMTALTAGDWGKVDVSAGLGAILARAGAGTNVLVGGGGDDIVLYDGIAIGSDDLFDAGAGFDRLALKGAQTVRFGEAALRSLEQIDLMSRDDVRFGASTSTSPSSFRLMLDDAGFSTSGAILKIDGQFLKADEAMHVDASTISAQIIDVIGGDGNDTVLLGTDDDSVRTGKGNDYVSIASGGVDTVVTGDGDDIVYAGDRLDNGDSIALGTGYDRLQLRGSYDILFDNGSTGLAITGLDQIDLLAGLPSLAGGAAAGLTYRLAFNSSWNYGNGNANNLVIDARGLTSVDTAYVAGPAYGALTYLGGGGVADVRGGTLNDSFYFGTGGFAPGSRVTGFAGNDVLKLQGDHRITVGDQIDGVESIELLSHRDATYGNARAAGYDYVLTYDKTSSPVFATTTIRGGALAASDRLSVDAILFGGGLTIDSGAGADRLIGGAKTDTIRAGGGDDFISIAAGGKDVVDAGSGNDGVYVGAAFDGDTIAGGAGSDQLAFQGNYQGTTLANITGFETIVLLSGYDTRFENPLFEGSYYGLVAPDALVAAGGRMIVTSNQLADNEYARFDARAETDASYIFFGGKGGDGFFGGAQSDGFYFGAGAFTYNDGVHGGDGADDQLGLQGDYSVLLNSNNMTGIETLVLLSSTVKSLGGGATEPFDYDVRMEETRGFDPATALTVNANTLQANEHLRFDASLNTRVAYTVFGGAGSDIVTGGGTDDKLFGRGDADFLAGGAGRDTLDGGDGNDELLGGLGADILTGGAGDDVFNFTDGAQSSSGAAYDVITDFDAAHDRIAVYRDETTHRGEDVTGVTLSADNFEGWMADALYGRLELGEVTVVRASAGTLAGHVFLVADQNGVAGYQPGEDLVVELGGGITTLPADLGWLAP